jgi:hypothetical protein
MTNDSPGPSDDQRLDEALEMTFPASDPLAVSRREDLEDGPSTARPDA